MSKGEGTGHRGRERGVGRRTGLTAAISILALSVALASGCKRARPELPPGVLSVSVEQESAWVRNFNPLGPGTSRFPTRAGVHEPLMILNGINGEWVPWLATSYEWSDGGRTLRFALREGVRWSDGQPFSAEDVRFTFDLLRRFPALDGRSVWSFLDDVRAPDPHAVEFDFSRVYIPGLADIAYLPIVPAHVWGQVDDPVTFANPDPVGTGPFTEIRVFRNQVYEVGRNPYYWQEGRPEVEALRFLAYPANDQANTALIDGSVDWAGNFVPAVERTYVARDPEHNHYWFPLVGSMVFLYANTALPPFDDVPVRKALSLAIDRDRLVEIAMFGYTVPANPTGLSDAHTSWRIDVPPEDDWVRYDPAAANRLLDEAGYTRDDDGVRLTREGRPFEFVIDVVSGWSDWVRGAQVVANDLREIGVQARLRPSEFSAWVSRMQRGDFEMAVSWAIDGATPYTFYRWMMSARTVRPVGESAPGNWHRFGDARTDELLGAFERTADPAEQHRLMAEVQARFVELAPAVPLFPNPLWAEYSTRRFVGWPTPEDPYAKPSPLSEPDCLLVMTAIRPRSE